MRESKDNLIGSFNRCDRGDTYVDHHVFFCLDHEKTGLNHLSFEVQDIDDVAMGHDYLAQFDKYEHMWGIGRHVLGSQVYDYWADPWGRVHEHWADSDRLNLANGSNLVPAEEALVVAMGRARRRRNSSITPAPELPRRHAPSLAGRCAPPVGADIDPPNEPARSRYEKANHNARYRAVHAINEPLRGKRRRDSSFAGQAVSRQGPMHLARHGPAGAR